MDNKKYISIEDAIKTTWMILDGLGYAFDENPQLTEAVLAVFDTAQTTDVRPVVRGRWKDAIQSCHDSPHVKCSVCGEYYWQYFKKFSFCPNCGADMRQDEAE